MLRLLAAMVVATLSLGCHTITEDLPSRPSPVNNVGAIPVIVIPVPALAPAPVPSPTPRPAEPAPTPRPTAAPPTGGVNDNTNPVDRVTAGVYFVECDGVPVPGTGGARSVRVGCRVHLDTTPRDGSHRPTNPKGEPRWTYSNPGMLNIAGNSPFNPVITGKGGHRQTMYSEVDGHRSEPFSIDFY